MDKKTGKKGFAALNLLPTVAMALGSTGIIVAIMLLVLTATQTQVGTQAGNTSAAWNATASTIQGVSVIPTWLPVVAIASVGGVILIIIGSLFYTGGGGKGK